MKISFWSNAEDKCSVSDNLAAISVASVIRYPYSIIVTENRLSSYNLGKAYGIPSNQYPYAGTNYYDGGGIEGLLRLIFRGSCSSEILKNHLKEIISEHLYYIPQNRVIHNDIFEYEFHHGILPLLDVISQTADICMINTASKENLSSKTILNEADLIVVNLCQNLAILEDFHRNYSSLISKADFLISDYVNHSPLNAKKISSMYQIPLDNILTLPKNILYENAYSNRSVVEFISSNYSCSKENPNYLFIQAIKKAAYRIIKRAEELRKDKEILLCQK